MLNFPQAIIEIRTIVKTDVRTVVVGWERPSHTFFIFCFKMSSKLF